MEFSDALINSFEKLMMHLAEPCVKSLVGQVKRYLQSLRRESGMMMSDEDSGLRNLWDEFCVQIQGEQSFFYSCYVDIVESKINELLSECSEDEKIILWTQTEEYNDWRYNIEDDCDDLNFTDVLKSWYSINDICEYMLRKVEREAANYTTRRIEDYLFS